MKYLKLFEAEEYEYYTTINYEEYMYKDAITFPRKARQELTKLGFEFFSEDVPTYHKLNFDYAEFDTIHVCTYICIQCFFGEDEWYYLHSNIGKIFRCDRLDGLLICLEKEFGFKNI